MLDDHVAGHNPALVYRKLDNDKQEIRLLTVQQGIDEEPVCCSLNYTFLTEPFPDSYETISYVWADENCRGSIILNGSIFDVPASAEEVLRRVRLVHTVRKVWIDAVCINQKDVRERESQVAIMSGIYGKTWRNLVWLGPDRERINERAIASITAILDDVRLETANFDHYVSKLYSQDQRFQFSGTGISLNIDWDAFDLYMAATWFTRLWVVQEAALATQSICLRGNTELPLTDVLRAACWVLHKSMFLPADLGRSRGVSCAVTIAMYADQEFGAYNFFHSQEAGSVALSSILDGMRVFDARDKRDYVYGLLGLYKKYSGCVVLPTCLKPDYTSAYTQVFREVARMTILEHAELTILENIHRRPLAEYVPSWVPLYHVKYDVEMDQIEVGEGSFRACGGLNLELADIQSPKDQNTLTLKGFQISQISEIGDEFTCQSCLQNGAAAYTKLLDKAEKMLNEVPNLSAHQRISTISHTLCYGKNGLGESIQHSQSLDLYTAFSKCIRENDSLPLLPEKLTSTEHHETRKASDYYQALYHACVARRTFITRAGQFGLAPSSVKSGDLVVILFGGRVPFVLRSRKDGEDNYELVGHCFMSDIMHGEAANAWIASGQDAKTFDLK